MKTGAKAQSIWYCFGGESYEGSHYIIPNSKGTPQLLVQANISLQIRGTR
jgi:hypothetical protein